MIPISASLRTGQVIKDATTATSAADALWLLSGLAGAASGIGGAIAANRQRRSQEALSQASLDLDREQGLMRASYEESMADPFRHQLSQAGAMTDLDRIEHASYAPFTVGLPDRYAKYKPTISGGYSWQPSDEVRAGAGKLKQSVMAGNTAPSMTSPDNYGKTATLDLYSGADPRTPAAFASGAPNTTGLGAPAAPTLRTPITTGKGSQAWRDGKNAERRAQEIAQFERQHPGWTVDADGRVARK